MPPEKMASQKKRFVFRPSIFRGKLTLSFKEGNLSHRKGIQNHRLKSPFGRDCDTYLHISTYTLVYLDIFHQAWIWLVISLQILPSEKILGGMSFHDGRSFRWQLTKQSRLKRYKSLKQPNPFFVAFFVEPLKGGSTWPFFWGNFSRDQKPPWGQGQKHRLKSDGWKDMLVSRRVSTNGFHWCLASRLPRIRRPKTTKTPKPLGPEWLVVFTRWIPTGLSSWIPGVLESIPLLCTNKNTLKRSQRV